MFLDFFGWLGWAYDLKTVPDKLVRDRVRRTGDGSHKSYGGSKSDEIVAEKQVWGWGDEDMSQEDYKIAEIYKPRPNPAG